MTSDSEILNAGFSCLLDAIGEIETERFVSILLRERADYTKWRQKYFNDATVEDFNAAAVEFAKACPFKSEKTLVAIDDPS